MHRVRKLFSMKFRYDLAPLLPHRLTYGRLLEFNANFKPTF